MKRLEGTTAIADLPEGKLTITVQNTNLRELARLYRILETMFSQGVMNVRNGSITLHFNEHGELRGVDMNASKWRDGKVIVNRVAMFEQAVVEIAGKG